MTQFRYVKQNYGCHCFYNDSSLKRYERYHNSGNNLIFNFGASNYGSCMPTCCGFWGGMTNWFGGLWGGMCNMFGGFGNWFGGCGCGFGGMFRGGFWGNFGAGIGMSLANGLMTLGGGLLFNWLGNIGRKPSVGDTKSDVKTDKDDEKIEKPEAPAVNPTSQDETPSDVLNKIGDINKITDPNELKNIRAKLQELLAKPDLSDADEQKAENLLKQVEDKLKLDGKLDLADDEVKVDGAIVKIDELTPVQIAELSNDDIRRLLATDCNLDKLLNKIGSKKSDIDSNCVTLPNSLDINSLKALKKIADAKSLNIAAAHNPKAREDQWIKGKIDNIEADANGKISFTVDCANVGKHGYKYTVNQNQDNQNWTIDLHEDSFQKAAADGYGHKQQSDYEFKNGELFKDNEQTVISKRYQS